MGVLLKIAYRNLREHKVKTLVIGSIIALGLVILVVGNSLLDTAASGIRAMYTENFTGEVAIASSRNQSRSLFTPHAAKNGEPTPTIAQYRELIAYLDGLPWVEKTVSQIAGMATAEVEGEGSTFVQLFGVSAEEYSAMFPETMEFIEGKAFSGDETGIILSSDTADRLAEAVGHKIAVGDKLLLTSANAVSGTKIREVEVRGIIRFPREAPNLSFISYVDLTTLRILSGMTKVTDVAAELSADERKDLGTLSEDDLFADGAALLSAAKVTTRTAGTQQLEAVLGNKDEAQLLRAVNPDAYHHVLIKLKSGTSGDAAIRTLNAHFKEAKLPLQAYGWEDAAGGVAAMVTGLKLIFNILIFVVGVVAVVIIMNTLVISVTERIGEIGTMRAIGAQRVFIRRMITLETLMIALVFGILGIAVGGACLGLIGMAGIKTTGLFLQVLFGGTVLKPVLGLGAILSSLAMVLAVGVLSSLYPVSVALGISPVRAMARR